MNEIAVRIHATQDDATDRLGSSQRMLDEAQQLLHSARAQVSALEARHPDDAMQVARHSQQVVEEAVAEISKALREAVEAQAFLGRIEGLSYALPEPGSAY